jgi:hypothetical protein
VCERENLDIYILIKITIWKDKNRDLNLHLNRNTIHIIFT